MPDRVLVVIIGEARAHELTFALFKQNVLDPIGADLALCVGSPRQQDDDNPFYAHAKHVWEFPEPTDGRCRSTSTRAATGVACSSSRTNGWAGSRIRSISIPAARPC